VGILGSIGTFLGGQEFAGIQQALQFAGTLATGVVSATGGSRKTQGIISAFTGAKVFTDPQQFAAGTPVTNQPFAFGGAGGIPLSPLLMGPAAPTPGIGREFVTPGDVREGPLGAGGTAFGPAGEGIGLPPGVIAVPPEDLANGFGFDHHHHAPTVRVDIDVGGHEHGYPGEYWG